MAFAEYDDAVEAVAADTADQALNVGILPRTPGGTGALLGAHAPDAAVKRGPINRVPVPQQVLRGAIPREGVDDLLSRPVRGGILGDVEMDDPSLVMCQHEQHEEDLETHSGYGEEIDGYELADVILEERPRSGGGRFAVANPILLHRAFECLLPGSSNGFFARMSPLVSLLRIDQ